MTGRFQSLKKYKIAKTLIKTDGKNTLKPTQKMMTDLLRRSKKQHIRISKKVRNFIQGKDVLNLEIF